MNRAAFRILTSQAERFVPQTAKRIERTLRAQVRAFAAEIEQGRNGDAALEEFRAVYEQQMVDAKEPWALAFAVDGFALAGTVMGKSACLASMVAKAGAPVDVDLFGADELVANHLRPHVGKWVAATSKIETATTAKQLGRIYRAAQIGYVGDDGERYGLTPREMANYILQQGNALMPSRANMLARTMNTWAYSEGAMGLYETEGVAQGQWMATVDDATAEWDASMDGKIVPIRQPFAPAGATFTESTGRILEAPWDIVHPPLHPNCRCTILPVLDGME